MPIITNILSIACGIHLAAVRELKNLNVNNKKLNLQHCVRMAYLKEDSKTKTDPWLKILEAKPTASPD